jgi:DNA helicase TIP49 (TBP-interacting protein)
VEEIDIDEESLAYLGEIGQQTSLRLDFVLFFGIFHAFDGLVFK